MLHPNWLVVSTPLKNMKVNGKDYPMYYGKIKAMFQTTNQFGIAKINTMLLVSWDDYSQYIMENKSHVPNHQPD